MSSLVGPTNDLDNTPFRSLRPRSQISLSGGGVSSTKTQGPVVCSVAPNLPARPPSSSDNDSIRKNNWDMDYEGACLYHFKNILHDFDKCILLVFILEGQCSPPMKTKNNQSIICPNSYHGMIVAINTSLLSYFNMYRGYEQTSHSHRTMPPYTRTKWQNKL